MDLSVILVTFNSYNYLEPCLDSLFASEGDFSFEIICVDNASQDDTTELIQKSYPSINLIINQENLGFAAANNKGLKRSKGQFILFLNPDTVLHKQAIENALKYLKGHLKVGIVGARLLNPDGTIQDSCASFPSLWGYFLESTFLYYLFCKTKLLKNGRAVFYNYDIPFPVDVVKGAFLLAKRDVINEIRGFDESFFMYSEEDDFCYRAKQCGWQIFVVPNSEVVHHEGGSSMPIWNRMFVEQHKSKILYYAKIHGKAKAQTASLILFLGVVIRLFAWAILALGVIISGHVKKKYVLIKFKNYVATFFWYLKFGFRATGS